MTEIRIAERLTSSEVAAVLELVRLATDEDGVAPLSEHVMLHLRYGGARLARNVLLMADGEIAGYAHLDPTDPVEGPSGELVIHPAYRRRHFGLALVQALAVEAGAPQLRLWGPRAPPPAAALPAAARGGPGQGAGPERRPPPEAADTRDR